MLIEMGAPTKAIRTAVHVAAVLTTQLLHVLQGRTFASGHLCTPTNLSAPLHLAARYVRQLQGA